MVTKRADLDVIATIHDQGNQFAVLNEDGSPRVLMNNHSPCVPVVGNIDLIGRCAEAALNTFQPCPGLEVQHPIGFCNPTGEGCQPAAIIIDHDLRRKVTFKNPVVAPYAVAAGQQQVAALVPNRIERIEAGMANELMKKAFAIPGEAEIPQAHLAGIEAIEATIADPRALLSSLTKVEKINLTAPAHTRGMSRAAFIDKVDYANLYNPAARGATAYYFCQAAVPFQVQQRL